jgi:hypothetical protein
MVRFDVVRASITNVFEPAQSNTRVPGTWRGGARKWKEWQNRDSHARFATEPASSSSSRSRAPSAFPAAIPSFSCQSNSSRAKSIPCMTNWSLAPNQRIKVAGPCEMARQSKRTFGGAAPRCRLVLSEFHQWLPHPCLGSTLSALCVHHNPWHLPPLHTGWLVHHLKALGGHLHPMQMWNNPICKSGRFFLLSCSFFVTCIWTALFIKAWSLATSEGNLLLDYFLV